MSGAEGGGGAAEAHPTQHSVEYAPSGRACCKDKPCGLPIGKDFVRIKVWRGEARRLRQLSGRGCCRTTPATPLHNARRPPTRWMSCCGLLPC